MEPAAEIGSTYNFEIRAQQPGAMVEPVRQAVRAYDPNLPLDEIRPLSVMTSDALNHEHLLAKLVVVFGVLALLLALIGLYGLISYTIARRTNEIGIRIALGAARPAILGIVLRETLLLVLAGVAIGVPATLALGRLVASTLFGLSPRDPVTLTAATVILLASRSSPEPSPARAPRRSIRGKPCGKGRGPLAVVSSPSALPDLQGHVAFQDLRYRSHSRKPRVAFPGTPLVGLRPKASLEEMPSSKAGRAR